MLCFWHRHFRTPYEAVPAAFVINGISTCEDDKCISAAMEVRDGTTYRVGTRNFE